MTPLEKNILWITFGLAMGDVLFKLVKVLS